MVVKYLDILPPPPFVVTIIKKGLCYKIVFWLTPPLKCPRGLCMNPNWTTVNQAFIHLDPQGSLCSCLSTMAKVYSLFSPWQGIIKKANLLSKVRTIGYPTGSLKSNCPLWNEPNWWFHFIILCKVRNKLSWLKSLTVYYFDPMMSQKHLLQWQAHDVK